MTTTQVVFETKERVYYRKGKRLIAGEPDVYHYATQIGVNLYKTRCGLEADTRKDGVKEYPAMNAGGKLRCCKKCLEFSSRKERLLS